MKFCEILRELLEIHNITQKQLADDLFTAPSTIGNYVRGIREPDFDTLKQFAEYFNVTTDYLLDYSPKGEHTHDEDEILYIYRTLDHDKKKIMTEQSKVLLQVSNK